MKTRKLSHIEENASTETNSNEYSVLNLQGPMLKRGATASSYNLAAYTSTATISSTTNSIESVPSTTSLSDEGSIESKENGSEKTKSTAVDDATVQSRVEKEQEEEEEVTVMDQLTTHLCTSLCTHDELSNLTCHFMNLFCSNASTTGANPHLALV